MATPASNRNAPARVIIEVVLLAGDLSALIRGASRMVGDAMVAIRDSVSSVMMVRAIAQAEKVAPGIVAAGKGVAGAAKEAMNIYEELAVEINAYKRLRRKTGAFNNRVRDITGLKLTDTEYIKIRLDAQHIVEDTWHEKFAPELKRIFGWETSKDMDAIALHTSWHIRSGQGLATKLDLVGAGKEVSLTKALQDFLKNAQKAPDGTTMPFANIQQLFQAHEDFYKSYSPRLWPRLQGWFNDALQRIAAAGPPP